MRTRTVGWGVLALCLLLCALLAGCGGSPAKAKGSPSASPSTPTPTRTDVPAELEDVAMARPGPFDPPIESADILVSSKDPLPDSVVEAASKIPGVVATERFSLATFYVEEEAVTYAAVNPATFRRFSNQTATVQDIWDRVADGEIAIKPELEKTLPVQNGYLTLGNDQDAEKAHIGALGVLVDRSGIGAVLNERWASKLHMPKGNALLVSTGSSDPATAQQALAKLVGGSGSVVRLALSFDIHAAQQAILTGGSVARAVGSFTYTANPNGTVNPDPRWVRQYIRTEQVPILGSVRCNKVMLPQLRAALTDVVKLHLASKIHPSQYGGCYVPRFIARDPSKGLSFHTWGTAIDLNVAENQRGTVGLMDRRVVAIFRKWGFNWGGTWHYTDPMHFELARIVKVG